MIFGKITCTLVQGTVKKKKWSCLFSISENFNDICLRPPQISNYFQKFMVFFSLVQKYTVEQLAHVFWFAKTVLWLCLDTIVTSVVRLHLSRMQPLMRFHTHTNFNTQKSFALKFFSGSHLLILPTFQIPQFSPCNLNSEVISYSLNALVCRLICLFFLTYKYTFSDDFCFYL